LEIFTRYADGETMTQIIDSLNERGIRSKKGNKFNKNSSMHNMLKNKTYTGQFHRCGVLMDNAVPAIVPQEIFDKIQERMARNKHASAAAKAPDEYVLTLKLFCGHCGKYMIGESGKSHTGKIYNYYKCGSAKRNHGSCDKKPVKKDWIERLVVSQTKQFVLQDDVIDRIADTIVELQKKENPALPLLRKQLKETEKGISNMLDAIQQGIVNEFTKQRLDELGERKTELEISIAKEQIQQNVLTKEQIVFFIQRFKEGDIDDTAYRRRMIDVFVNSIYLYDDKLALFFNYKDGTKTITFDSIKGSDIGGSTPPLTPYSNRTQKIFGYGLKLFYSKLTD
jgi:hypothetical protein